MVDQEEIHRKVVSDDVEERRETVMLLRDNFADLPDKELAWKDLIRLMQDKDIYVRWATADILVFVISQIPDREKGWTDLIRLTRNKGWEVRRSAAYALGSAFQHVPDKNEAWEYLIRLTGDWDNRVQVSANHSLGRASIFKATEAEDEEVFKSELKNAIEFFERSSKEAIYSNPSRFCLPFYRSFYSLTFEKAGAEGELKRYLAEAKSASEGSENKEILLKAVENLANALSEARR